MPHHKRVLAASLALCGCSGVWVGGRPVPPGLIRVELTRPLTIPAGRAHATFQGGGQVGGVNRYSPWCELEIDTVSPRPQRVEPIRISIDRVGDAFIKDYNTRMPALIGGLSCSDLVFQETTWWAAPESYPVLYLRCYAPYTNCIFGPPLSPGEMQGVVGPGLDIRVGADSWGVDEGRSQRMPRQEPALHLTWKSLAAEQGTR